MSSANVQAALLRRTKFAQTRTSYNIVRNTLLSVHQRHIYIVEPFEQLKWNRQLIAIKKAFACRRNSRKGPFQRLLAPHTYSDLFGDPAYYSNTELHRTCTMAAEMGLTDRLFWWQICEKLRKVRDVMNITHLLSCLSSVVNAKYFDPDLMRVLSREFADDMKKLSLAEIAELLQCYVRASVYSVDLVASAGNIATKRLMAHVEGAVYPDVSTSKYTQGDSSSNHEADTTLEAQPEILGLLAKCFRYFSYKNKDLYLSIAFMAMKHWRRMDLYGKCAVFANLDPRDFNPADTGTENSSSAEISMEITRETTTAMMRLFNTFDDEYCTKGLRSITDEVNFGAIVPPNVTGDLDDYVTNLHDLCCTSGAMNNIAKVVCRLVDNIAYTLDKASVGDFAGIIDTVIGRMAAISVRLTSSARDFLRVARKLECNTTMVNGSGQHSDGEHRAISVFVDSTLRSVCAVNAALRYKMKEVHPDGKVVMGSDVSLSMSDGNMHARLYELKENNPLGEHEYTLLSHFMDSLETFGCPSQEPELLTTALETLAVVSLMKCPYAIELVARAQAVNDIISQEILKHLVTFGNEARYRVLLVVRNGKLTPNAYLEHAIRRFTKYVRMTRCGVKFAITPPYQFLLKERAVPSEHAIEMMPLTAN